MTPKLVKLIVERVAASHGLTYHQVIGQRRLPHIVRARDEAIYELWSRGLSVREVGNAIKRHHTSVIASLRRTYPDYGFAAPAGALPPEDTGKPRAWLVKSKIDGKEKVIDAAKYDMANVASWISPQVMDDHHVIPLYCHPQRAEVRQATTGYTQVKHDETQ